MVPALGIRGFGGMCASLADVFLRICEGVVDLNDPADARPGVPTPLHHELPSGAAGAAGADGAGRSGGGGEGAGGDAAGGGREEGEASLPSMGSGTGAALFAGGVTLRALAGKLLRTRVRGRRALAHFILYPVVVVVVSFALLASAYFALDSLPMLAGARLRVAGAINNI